ncbi:unnamed protein product [Paramecium octaurelia]|uniref:PX domain-containing protein n=1 Tax=Paramecium octaurelia TaxID=43137 RepID=A0A8S1Y8J6_PAROT|nr:unnamed protein product [Paramecium octaurelia]
MQDYIKIIDAQVMEESLINYTQYQIKGIRKGEEFLINKRYNDFVILKEVFNRTWPGCFIPPIPQKKSLGNLDSNVITYRSKYLSYFLKKILKIPYLWLGEEISIFIKGTTEQLQEMAKNKTLQQIISKYEETFTFNENQQVYDIDQFYSSTCHIIPMIENFSAMAKNLIKEKESQNQGFIMFVEHFLPQFEKLQQQNHQVFSNQETQEQFQLSKKCCTKNEYNKVFEYTKIVERELIACKDALVYRNTIVQKVKEEDEKLYKLNIQLQELHSKTLLFGKKEEKVAAIQNQIQQQQSTVESLKQLLFLINKLISQQEIPNFYRNTKEKYLRLIKVFSDFQIKYHQSQTEFWEKIQLKI